jgi:hypothetical protein
MYFYAGLRHWASEPTCLARLGKGESGLPLEPQCSTEELPCSYLKETVLQDSQRPVLTGFPFAPELSQETPRI